MDGLYFLFQVVIILGVIAVGAWMAVFNRQFSEGSYRFAKAAWGMNYSDTDIRMGRIFGAIIGIVLVGGGIAFAIGTLFS